MRLGVWFAHVTDLEPFELLTTDSAAEMTRLPRAGRANQGESCEHHPAGTVVRASRRCQSRALPGLR